MGEDDDGPYLIMDYVEGVSLSRAIRQTVRSGHEIPMQVAIRICREVALGLHAAHEVRSEDGTVLHLVHRDVSPQNVLIGFDGSVRVADFGIAKALGNASQTNAGVLKGNMGYLSPEQLRFEEADRRSDIFSLGVTLYELLSGARLYPNTDGFDGTRRILSEPPPDIGEVRNDVPPELVELLFEMLAKDRNARPTTTLEIAGRLEAILAPLIAEEGSVTIADFMDQHFALERQQHRAYLAEHLKRLNDDAPATSRTSSSMPALPAVPSAPSPTVGHGKHLSWLSLAGAVAAAVFLIERGGCRIANRAAVGRNVLFANGRGGGRPGRRAGDGGAPCARRRDRKAACDRTPRSPPRRRQRDRRPTSTPALAELGRPTRIREQRASRRAPSGAISSGRRNTGQLAVPIFTQWR